MNNNSIYILHHSKLELAKAALENIRRQPKANLGYECKKAIEALKKEAELCPKSQLVVGRQYGILYVSPFANAWRNGVLQVNHGEAYIGLWVYQENGKLASTNAWGATTEMDPGELLIEM